MKLQTFLTITISTICLLLFSFACKEVKNPEQESDSRQPVNTQDIVDLMFINLEQDGTTDVELSLEQRNSIKSSLSSLLIENGLTQSSDLATVMSLLSGGSLEVIGAIDPPLTDIEKVYVLENILGSQAEVLQDRVSAAEAATIFGKMSQSAVENLDSLNLGSTSNPEAMQYLAASLIKSTIKLAMDGQSAKETSSAIIESLISQSGTQGWNEDDRYTALNAGLKGAIEGLNELGLNSEEYEEAVADVVRKAAEMATANEISSGKTTAELMDSVDDIANNILTSLAEAGVPTSICSETAKEIISGTAQELASVLNADQLNQALLSGIDGIVEGLDQAGATAEEKSSARDSCNNATQEETSNATDPSTAKLKIGDQKLSTTEGSDEKGSFLLSLEAKPAAPISVSIISRDETEGIVSPTSLTIDAGNWYQPQKVTISPKDDWIVDDEVSYSIVIKTNGELNKTLVAKNADNDVVGIKVTPTKTQYSSEVGGEVHFQVSLTSQPKGPIMLRWAVTSGQDSIIFDTQYREMTFPVNHEGVPHTIKIKGKTCNDCTGHSSVTIKSQNIISVDDQDTDYPNLTPVSVSFDHLKGGPKIKTTDFAGDNLVKVNFDDGYLNFSKPDDEYIYETVFETESIDLTYAKYQSRPLLIKETDCFNGAGVDLNVTSTPATPPATGFNYSFTFCLKFYNADLAQTSAGTGRWASSNGFNRNSCSSISSRYVRCNFSGSGNSLPSSVIPKNTIFSGTSTDKIGNDAFNIAGGSGYYSSPPAIPGQTDQPTVTLKYKKLSIEGTRTAYFASEGNLSSGFWYLSDKSKSFVLGNTTYSDSNYFYIHVP